MSEHNTNNNNKKAIVIEIPSYKDVIDSTSNSQSNTTPVSLFTPSESFSQAFASIKNSKFYSPPPPPPPPPQPSNPAPSPSPSSSSVPATTSSGNNGTTTSATTNVQRTNAILVSHRQKGNPLLKHIRNVRWNFAEIIPDYVTGQNSCALYLSLRYHLLHPDYLYFRIRELQKNFRLRVILCHVDVDDVVKPLLEVTRTALFHDCTLLCAWSLEECGRYLETIKVYENKPADIIQGHMDTDYLSRLNHALTAVRHVNKTDVVTLGSTFGSLAGIMDASMEDLARCPGIGERKVKRLYETFHEPFKRVVPVRTADPEETSQRDLNPNADLSSTTTEIPSAEKEREDRSKLQKKEPDLTVKSALSAAFSKYSEKITKKSTVLAEPGEGSGVEKDVSSTQT